MGEELRWERVGGSVTSPQARLNLRKTAQVSRRLGHGVILAHSKPQTGGYATDQPIAPWRGAVAFHSWSGANMRGKDRASAIVVGSLNFDHDSKWINYLPNVRPATTLGSRPLTPSNVAQRRSR